LRKGQAFSVARRAQAIAFAEQYQQAGRFCILVEQDGMLTLYREESPVDQPPDAPVMQAETPSAKPLRWHFLFAPKVSTPLLPERYRRLPQEEQEVAQLLCHVRRHFPKRQLRVDGLTWEYWAGGSGATGVLFLPGTVPFGDMWFAYLHHWQGDFRLIAPTYPAASRIEQLVEGIRQILKQEQLQRVHLIGQSLGGDGGFGLVAAVSGVAGAGDSFPYGHSQCGTVGTGPSEGTAIAGYDAGSNHHFGLSKHRA
jgi:hypothetical protein